MVSLAHEAELDRAAELYSLLHRGNPGDLEFYLRCCESARTVLELGVGYGRVACRLAAQGLHVTGLDNHAGLLRMAQANARLRQLAGQIDFALGDMCRFDLGRRFDRILIPFSGLFCLLDDAAVAACFAACRRHLSDGGVLAFDVYEADSFHLDENPTQDEPSESEILVALDDGLQTLLVYERSDWYPERQRLDVHYDYRDSQGELVHTATIQQRYLLVDQIRHHLARSGFVCRNLAGGFAGEAAGPDSEFIVVEAALV